MKLALRSLLQTPAFTTIALVTLALGIGVNTAMFSLVNTLLLKPAPFSDPAQLVRVFRQTPQSQTWPHSAGDAADLEHAAAFAAFGYYDYASFILAEPGQPAERVAGQYVSTAYFRTLGVQPMLGRTFTPAEFTPGQDNVAIISEALWHGRFNDDPGVIGRTLRMDGVTVTVVGVMSAEYDYPLLWGKVDVRRPLALTTKAQQDRGNHYLQAIGRLKPGVSLRQAQAELTTLAARLAQQFPDTNAGGGINLVPLHLSTMDKAGRSVSLLVLGLAGFVLLIACANLANLQLARAGARLREFAIRAALGASRARLIRDLLTESLLLSITGGLLGLLVAKWMTDALSQRISAGDGGNVTVSLDPAVLAFTLAASIVTGLLFGIVPAWTASQTDVSGALKAQSRGATGDRSHHRLRHGLIMAEVALALMLLAGAGFFIRGLHRYLQQDLGWERNRLLTAQINLPTAKYPTEETQRAFYRQLEERLQAMPGVERATIASSLPIGSFNRSQDFVPADRPPPPPGQAPMANYTSVSADFFATLQIPIVAGTALPRRTTPGAPLQVVINEAMAQKYWPGASALGKLTGSADPGNKEWYEVIGVVRDVKPFGNLTQADTNLQTYVLLDAYPTPYVVLALRSTLPPSALAASLRDVVASLDRDLPVYNVRTPDDTQARGLRNYELVEQLLTGFGILGLLLAAVGLYGVISGLVVRRTAEFGIRLALGAQPEDVLRLVLGGGAQLAAIGAAIGLAGAFALQRFCSSLLPGLPGNDALLLAATTVGLFGVALFACWIPARRATRIDPMIALRVE